MFYVLHLFVYTYLLSLYCVLGSVLDAGDALVSKTDLAVVLRDLHSHGGKINNEQLNEQNVFGV